MAAAGTQAEKCLQDTIANNSGQYILCCEGAVPTALDGAYCRSGGTSAIERLKQVAANAKAIVAWGNCASSGGIQAAQPNPTGATPIHKIITDKSVVRVQGCPPMADVMVGVIVYLLTYGKIPDLDSLGRPKSFYNRRVHDTCNRRPSYDYGDFVLSFDDANARTGYGCLYKMGCRGLTTYNSCSTIRWNGGIGSPMIAGHGCIGCSEENFWDNGSFYDPIKIP
jgi:hydrogenase small subunit